MMWRKFAMRMAGASVVIIQYGCIAHCTLEFVADLVVCSGPSMMPTINPSDVVMTEHYSVNFRRITTGDIVVCRSPSNPRQFICKRVKGVEGDRMDLPPKNSLHYNSRLVPRGHVWLEGDNSENSTDSRLYGPIPYGLIRGRVFMKIWPLWDAGKIRSNDRRAS